MGKQRTGLRTFYYFRQGYAQYLALGVGVANVLTSTYFLAIEKIPSLKSIIPSFEIYVSICVIVGIPLITFFGWVHFKKAGTYSSESSISIESNPYNYRWLPGYTKNVYGPAYTAILNANVKKIKGEQLSEQEINEIKKLENDLIHLIKGGYVGNPPTGALK
jgi:hypothetical protein